jgi:DNA ligase (NAD+)
MDGKKIVKEIEELSKALLTYQHEYYVLGQPTVTDTEYDRLFNRLLSLEINHPELKLKDSPTSRVGSDLTTDLPEVKHTIPVLSLDKGYTTGEILTWMEKNRKAAGRDLSFIVEEKIDGVSIVLYYEQGRLHRAVTRGNGSVGNDVTANVRTIGSVPLRLSEPITLAVRGEIYLQKDRFEKLNRSLETPYANPRNLAAGTLRRIKSADAARVPLDIFIYEGFFQEQPETHEEILSRLISLGFKLNRRVGIFFAGSHTLPKSLEGIHSGTFNELESFIDKSTMDRENLPYEIDGLVIKVNELPVREILGYTGHHPRWAIAYKFESPEGETRVKGIDIQVGRTGRITPVARVEPVLIGGSTIQNVTLHNQEYIQLLELSIGDDVTVSKRGDVIPAVERVTEKAEGGVMWKMPQTCPSCGSPLDLRGAHHFCPNRECPDQVRGRLTFFVARGQMDIEGFGPETIDFLLKRGMITDIQDIYTCDYSLLADLPGFREKKINIIKQGVDKSRGRSFQRVLASLGIPELGPKVCELLITHGVEDIEELFRIADSEDVERLVGIPGIGEKTAARIIGEMGRPELRVQIAALKTAGISFKVEVLGDENEAPRIFVGQAWCVTGSFEHFSPREKAMKEIRLRGGRTVTAVTSKTTCLLAGSGGGGKRSKAEALGVPVISEEEFLRMLESKERSE